MVAQQTLTLYAWVRILVPLPKKNDHHPMVVFLSFGIETAASSPVTRQGRGVGFAFERKPSGSLLTSGEAKNLLAWREYPSSATITRWSFFLSFGIETAASSPVTRQRRGVGFAYPAQSASSSLVSGKRGYPRHRRVP